MSLLKSIYHVVLDSLFPLSGAEKELFSYSPETAWEKLPPAPPFNNLTVPLPETRALFAYKDERVAKLIWNIKYKRSLQAVRIGGYALWKGLQMETPILGATYIMLVPIPITPKRRRERGFNQCELLADEVKRLRDRSDLMIDVEKELLVRVQHSSRQTLKGRGERLEGAKGIFDVNEEVVKTIKSAIGSNSGLTTKIVIIDDVITTGSTMKEALDTLKLAGFPDVQGLSLAH